MCGISLTGRRWGALLLEDPADLTRLGRIGKDCMSQKSSPPPTQRIEAEMIEVTKWIQASDSPEITSQSFLIIL